MPSCSSASCPPPTGCIIKLDCLTRASGFIMQPHKAVIAARPATKRGGPNGETDELSGRRLPDRALAGRAGRLVVVPDHPCCVVWRQPFRRIPEEAWACQEYPRRTAAHAGR